MKLMDFDGLFDEKLTQYMEENKGKYTEKQWESLIPRLYEKFGNTYVGKIKCTPKEYYAKMTSEELVDTLSAHLKERVPVPEFLCAEIENRGDGVSLLPLLESKDEETVLYAINLLGADNRAFGKYFELLTDGEVSEEVRDAAVDCLKFRADDNLETALAYYREGKAQEYVLEIFSRLKTRSEEAYQILLTAFLEGGEKRTLYTGYLAAYGDDRALPYLYKKIEDRTIGFVEFQELKYAIEALGGEYNEPRDFSDDRDFKRIEDASLTEGFGAELKS